MFVCYLFSIELMGEKGYYSADILAEGGFQCKAAVLFQVFVEPIRQFH